jgi:predicted Zn-dependent protease with MMP-like domain
VKEENLDFYKLVERALDGLPPELSSLLDNVAIVVDDWPDYSTPLVAGGPNETLYGLYEGVPLTERGAGYYGFLPDRITIFRGPLERDFATRDLEEQVRITVVHEIAHYFSTRSVLRNWGGDEVWPRRQREHRATDGGPRRESLSLHI